MRHTWLWLISGLCMALSQVLSAQDDTSLVKFEGYAEAYFGLQQTVSTERPDFLYNHTADGIGLNLGWVRWTVEHKRWRMVAAPMLGTYVDRNLAGEPNAVRYIYEASIGYRLGGADATRLDVGVMPSHIGLESNVGRDNLNLTRSLLAENTPYYECGIRWSGQTSSGIHWGVYVLNGWQRIAEAPDRTRPAFGVLLQHENGRGRLVNYSNYIGTIDGRFTLYHNVYGKWKFGEYWMLNAEVNYEAMADEKDFVGGSIAIGRRIKEDFTLAARVEQVRDFAGSFYSTRYAPAGINPGGWSVNLDYDPHRNVKLRGEARRLWSAENVAFDALAQRSADWFYTVACCLSF